MAYASFKNVSELILSMSPPEGSLSYFFMPKVSRPVDKRKSKRYLQVLAAIKWLRLSVSGQDEVNPTF